MSQHCLSRASLEAMLDERLAEPERTTATRHFSACPTCQALAEEIIAELGASALTPHPLSDRRQEESGKVDSLLLHLRNLPSKEEELDGAPTGMLVDGRPPVSDTVTQDGSTNSVDAGRINIRTGPIPHETESGASIGPYRLDIKLGEGGFGIVYRAEQRHPFRRIVALKVIKPGMDSREVIARFDAERQTLALMDHPHIARVLDAGTTIEGRPYFVMELVAGIPITHYCAEHGLTIRERLELFITVCEAVQHAHQKGIIHRDLKPSNVLVGDREGKADAKVIDFGIAKALTSSFMADTAMTKDGQMIGTLLYMSSEQLGAADVDTRSDVYSLGVLLYELLTGTTPFASERLKALNRWDAIRIIREEEPLKPSTRLAALENKRSGWEMRGATSVHERVRQVCGDLDWITLKTLEKDRDRRYESASALAGDVRRHLSHEPVVACPPTTAYRLRKFIRRNQLLLGAILIVCVALVTGGTVAVVQTMRAYSERSRANEKEFQALKDQLRATNAEKAQHRETNIRLDLLYASEIQLASQRLEFGDDEQAELLLNHWIPSVGGQDRRGFEWRWLKQQLRPPQQELLRLPGDVSTVRIAPDQSYLVTATDGGTIRRYSLLTEQELPAWEARLTDVRRMEFSPNGQLLAIISYEGDAVLMDTSNGQPLHRFPRPQNEQGGGGC